MFEATLCGITLQIGPRAQATPKNPEPLVPCKIFLYSDNGMIEEYAREEESLSDALTKVADILNTIVSTRIVHRNRARDN